MHCVQAKTLDTGGLRRQSLIEDAFRPGEMTMTYSHID
jgi:4-deoxy-L-threo-5-hexosulose-uronate ketol-isomerase